MRFMGFPMEFFLLGINLSKFKFHLCWTQESGPLIVPVTVHGKLPTVSIGTGMIRMQHRYR